MKPGLSLKLSQHLTLTPQLQQSIRLLQMSTVELEQEVDKYLQENPFLERVDGDDAAPPPEPGLVAISPTAPAIAEPQTDAAPENPESGEDRAFDDADYVRDSWTDVDGGSRNGGSNDDPLSFQRAATATLREHLLAQLGPTTLS